MQPLVAVAADQTGRTITFLSVGLLAIAAALTALTIWYWRFTRPVHPSVAPPDGDVEGDREPEPVPPPAHAPSADDEWLDVDAPPERDEWLDVEQWALLSRAVLNQYFESDDDRSPSSADPT